MSTELQSIIARMTLEEKAALCTGASAWTTTLNAKAGAWTLPIRKPVRLAEGLAEGMLAEVVLRVL